MMMKPSKPTTIMRVSLVMCGVLMNTGTVNANCFDEFVVNNPEATEFGCCENSGDSLTVPASITQLTKLTSINLEYCEDVDRGNIIGTFPTAGWDKLVDLKELYMPRFSFEDFNVPATLDLSSLPSLTALHLSNMTTTGEIPEWLLTMTNLKALALEYCYLTGTLPLSLKRLSNLVDIRLTINRLTGPIPAWFFTFFTELEHFSIEGNSAEFQAIRGLEVDELKGGFSGTISSSIKNLKKLTNLELSANIFNGILPSELGELTDLMHLGVAFNQFTKTVPSSFGQLVKLTILRLSNNTLTGSLPAELSALTDLEDLYIENTRLHDPLPDFADTVYVNDDLTHLAPGADCSSPANQTMCTWGDDKCEDGICAGRTDAPTNSPTTAAPTVVPTTDAPTVPTTDAPTDAPTAATKAEDQTLLFVGAGVGCVLFGFVAALCLTGRLKLVVTNGESSGATTAALASPNEVKEEIAVKQVASNNPGFDGTL